MTLAIILIVVLAVGFLVAIRIVGMNKDEKNLEEDCSEDEVMSASEIRKLSIEERKPILDRAAKRAKDEGDYE